MLFKDRSKHSQFSNTTLNRILNASNPAGITKIHTIQSNTSKKAWILETKMPRVSLNPDAAKDPTTNNQERKRRGSPKIDKYCVKNKLVLRVITEDQSRTEELSYSADVDPIRAVRTVAEYIRKGEFFADPVQENKSLLEQGNQSEQQMTVPSLVPPSINSNIMLNNTKHIKPASVKKPGKPSFLKSLFFKCLCSTQTPHPNQNIDTLQKHGRHVIQTSTSTTMEIKCVIK